MVSGVGVQVSELIDLKPETQNYSTLNSLSESAATIHFPALSLANSSGLMVQKGVPSFVNRTLYS